MLHSLISKLQQNKAFRGLIILLLALVLIVILFRLFNKPDYVQHYVFETELIQNENFSYLDGNTILAYNGLSFYQINQEENNKITVLSAGQKLPKPETIVWAGNKGALMTFKESFTYTRVDEELKKLGKQVDSTTKNYVWYVDFSSSSLRLVSEDPLHENLATFSQKDNGFYAIVEQPKGDFTKTPLVFYDLNSVVTLADSVGYGQTLNIYACPSSSESICIVSLDEPYTGKQILQKINRSGERKAVYDVQGQIFGTSRSDYILTSTEDSDKDNKKIEGDVFQGEASLVNLDTKEETALNFMTAGSSVISNIADDGVFYVLDTVLGSTSKAKNSEPASYTSGLMEKTSVDFEKKELLAADGSLWANGIINTPSYGNRGKTLLADYSGRTIIISPDKEMKEILVKNLDEVKKTVSECGAANGFSEYEYFEDNRTFRLYFVETVTWQSQLKNFSSCVNTPGGDAMYGYYFQIFLRDARNGKLISD